MPHDPLDSACPTCYKPLRVPAESVGKNLRCPACGTTFPAAPPRAVPVTPADPFDFAGDDAPVDSEPAEEAAYFTVIEARTWTPNRVYRVYSDRKRLVGLYIGRSADTAVLGAQFGLVGGLIAGIAAARGAAANKRRDTEQAEKTLDELVAAHRYNFVHDATEVDAAGLAEPSLWFRLNHATVPQIALLHLTTADGAKRRFALAAEKDVRVALDLLGDLLGDRFDEGDVGNEYRRKGRR